MQLSSGDTSRFRHLCRALKLLADAEPGARRVITALLSGWMARVTPALSRPAFDDPDLSLAYHPAVEKFVDWLGTKDLLTGCFWLSSAYAFMVEKDQRKKQAMYFTPPHLANRLLKNAADQLLKGAIVDPACGGAAFLAPAAARISEKLEREGRSSKEILSHIEANLHGMDIDPFLCKLSTIFLRMVVAKHIIKAGYEPNFHVQCGDALISKTLGVGTYGLVLCNPPYRKLARTEVAPYAFDYRNLIHGQPNAYTLFIGLATSLVKSNGLAVFLTPMSFISGQSFTPLRRHLTLTGSVNQIDLIHDKTRMFLGAEQDSAITVWQKKRNSKATRIYTLSRDGSWELTGNPKLHASDAPWPLPRETVDAELLPLFQVKPHTLLSYGYVVRTGCVVMHRNRRKLYNRYPKATNTRCVLPLIWQSDISYKGTLEFEESNDNLARYIDMTSFSAAGVIKKPAVAVQRVTSNDQRRRLICAVVPNYMYSKFGGVVGENHVCFIEQMNQSAAVEAKLLCSILRTEIIDRLFRCISGATNVSAYELQALPLPPPEKVKSRVRAGIPIETAVREAFGL